MARTVDAAFDELISRLVTSGTETATQASHRGSIGDCLRAHFAMIAFFMSGSFGHGTNVRHHSDVDRFAVIPTDRLKADSDRTLAEIASTLHARFPQTRVAVDAPGVTIDFGDGEERNEVIPADHVATSGDFRIFEIPDGRHGWMRSAPEAHNAYTDMVDAQHQGKVKPLIRLLKAWKYVNGVPVSSFYLELFVASWARSEAAIIHKYDLRTLLDRLIDLPDLTDPMGITQAVPACVTVGDWLVARAAVAKAGLAANGALQAESRGDVRAAFQSWDNVFAGTFPGFY